MQQISKIQSLGATDAAVLICLEESLGNTNITASKRPFFSIFLQPKAKVKANYSFGLFTGLLLEVCWCQKVCLTQPVVNYFFGQVFAVVLRPKLHGMHKPHFNGDMACVLNSLSKSGCALFMNMALLVRQNTTYCSTIFSPCREKKNELRLTVLVKKTKKKCQCHYLGLLMMIEILCCIVYTSIT